MLLFFITAFLGLIVGGAYGPAEAVLGICLGVIIGTIAHNQRLKEITKWESRITALEKQLNALIRTLNANDGNASQSDSQTDTSQTDTHSTPSPEPTQPAISPIIPTPENTPSPISDVEPIPSAASKKPIQEPRPSFFSGINIFARIGIALILIAVSFLLKLAADNGFFPLEARLIGIAGGALILLILGWRLRLTRAAYSLILQGGGIAVLYFDVFAAFRLFDLLPAGFAFVLLVGIVACATILAVAQDAPSLAFMGTVGGFLAPLLTATGDGSHVALFSYYALINAGIFAVAIFKAWRPLNLVGFFFTFGIGAFWGAQYFTPELFATTQPFLILFILMYVGIAVFFALRRQTDLSGFVDGTLVFGTPLVGFGLQTALVANFDKGAAFSALAFGLFYLTLAKICRSRAPQTLNRLTESFLALGVVFATIAIPLGLDDRWTSATWALEGAGIVWVSVRQNRLLGRIFGSLLIMAAGLVCLTTDTANTDLPVVNAKCMGFVLVALSHLFAAAQFHLHRDRVTKAESILGSFLLLCGALWELATGINEISRFVAVDSRTLSFLAYASLTALAYEGIAIRTSWNQIRFANFYFLPIAALCAIQSNERGIAPLDHFGFLAWPLAFFSHGLILKRRDESQLGLWHGGGLWLLTWLVTRQAQISLDAFLAAFPNAGTSWAQAIALLIPAAALICVAARRMEFTWPLARHKKTYLNYGATPIAAVVIFMIVFIMPTRDGNSAPLFYVPIFNPVELVQIFALMALLILNKERLRLCETGEASFSRLPLRGGLFGFATFVFFNTVLARIVHSFYGVDYAFDALFASTILQTMYSIFWSILALTGMVFAYRRTRRGLWQVGAFLLGIVILKLFLVDLSQTGSIARIVSFLGVGVLVLVIGYFAPLPPKKS